MKNIIIGTSGHIDHGKSTLVQALTGTDPDRFEEEKKRGITIDIGFAHYVWRNLYDISFIDVPGHERFVHNMLAGVGGIQILILVVAADGGVMPQTREHLHICDLLNIREGMVVITRRDLADEEMVELVREEVKELTQSTFLEGKAVLTTSATTGEGLEEVKEEIAKVAASLPESQDNSPFRMPVDRSFSMKGFGTIVTGTVLSGKSALGDELFLYPQEIPLRLRGFQVHQNKTDTIQAGQRSAINISGLHKNQIRRGDQISTVGQLVITKVIEVELSIIPEKTGILKNRSKVRFFSNAQEVTGRLYSFQDFDPEETAPQYVQIRLEERICCRYGDRFIIRNLSPVETIAGGKVIAPFGNRSRKNKNRLKESLRALATQDEKAKILETVFLTGTKGIEADKLLPLVGRGQKIVQRSLQNWASQGELILINPERKKYLHRFHCERISGFFQRTLEIFHKNNPEKPGAQGSDFFGKMSKMFSPQEVMSLLNWSVKQKRLSQTDNVFHLPGFQGGLNTKQKEMKESVTRYLLEKGYQPPGLVNLIKELEIDRKELEKILKIGQTEKWIVRVKDDLWYHPDTITAVKERLLEHYSNQDTLTVVEFKELLNISRKHAVGLLEYFDGLHLTRRIENHRILHLNRT